MATETRTEWIKTRVTPEERSRWTLAAERGGRTLSQFIRWLLDREAETTVTKKGKSK